MTPGTGCGPAHQKHNNTVQSCYPCQSSTVLYLPKVGNRLAGTVAGTAEPPATADAGRADGVAEPAADSVDPEVSSTSCAGLAFASDGGITGTSRGIDGSVYALPSCRHNYPYLAHCPLARPLARVQELVQQASLLGATLFTHSQGLAYVVTTNSRRPSLLTSFGRWTRLYLLGDWWLPLACRQRTP